MAHRRMFSPDIVGSDAFLEMPTSTRELYFQLGMYADDDGFVNPKKIMRMIGASDDDLKVLIAKRFLLSFENGVVVIKHWLIHNMIRKDRYIPTQYGDQKNTLFIKENKAYSELEISGQPDGNQKATQYRLGKGSLGKDKGDITPAQEARIFFDGKFEPILDEFILKSNAPPELLRQEFSKFILYWTEKNKSGTRQRWETERTFEVRRRLATWLNNIKQFQKVEFNRGRGIA